MAYISLKAFLIKERYNEIFSEIEKHYDRFAPDVEVQDFHIDKIFINDEGRKLDIWLSVDVDCEKNCHGFTNRIYMSMKASPSKDYRDIKVYNVKHDFYKSDGTFPVADDLVPYIKREQLDDVAHDFLSKYYPEALTSPTPIDAVVLAERMGLEVIERSITADNSVFGQIAFQDTEAELINPDTGELETVELDEGTICVDPEVYFLRSYGAVQNTIVHECVHWDLHKKTFDLGYLQDNDTTKMICQVIGGTKVNIKGCDTKFIEWQANALAPRIQMPLDMFKAKAKEYLEMYSEAYGKWHEDIVDVFPVVIQALANFFNVSKLAAKIRLYEVGYHEVAGVLEYVDDGYVKPYAFKKNAITRKQTYSIGFDNLLTEYVFNPSLKAAFDKGAFVYADCHVCLNDPKYVKRRNDGTFELTDYARYHIDECCIAFTLETKNRVHYSFCDSAVLYREASVLEFEAKFKGDDNASLLEKGKHLAEYAKENIEVIKGLKPTLGPSLEFLIKHYGMNYAQVAEAALISEKALRAIRNDESIPTKGTLTAICIALHLEPVVSRMLFDKIGINLDKPPTPENYAYNFILSTMYNGDIYDANNMLEGAGLKPLTGDYS